MESLYNYHHGQRHLQVTIIQVTIIQVTIFQVC